MNGRISEDLINFSAMLMTARGRGELVQLANELNSTILKVIELEKSGQLPQVRNALSAAIKFTKEEIRGMSKSFKKEFIANGCVAHVTKRPSGKDGVYYEIRYRRNGYNITVSNKDLSKAKQLFIERTAHLDEPTKPKAITFGQMADEWLSYKKGKITDSTWRGYSVHAQKYITAEMRRRDIRVIRTAQLSEFMSQFENQPRMYEEMRILLNSVFKYALLNGVISHNPVTLIPFKRAERISRRALTEGEIRAFLHNIQEPRFNKVRQTALTLYFFGVRPCELDDEAHFEDGFLVCRNRKRKGGKIEYKKIPVPEQAKEFIDFTQPLCPKVKSDVTLSRKMKDAMPEGLTAYNLRHTFATTCQQFVRPDIVDIWMGDSPERLVGRVYTHFSDDFMREQMTKVKFIT